ncbi:flavodoxin-dependent (E)-4-hydroxy-3-methylbut-2-enyl-diphosphate synthase [Syntrophus aciditrophicus]|uniref:4-hydroxy-3-methylbut-2-en-1-yl diphosphate synthase (flavodoxin) n=1 Tax=Syntrophus aciditrophicus (strain SB) TaxID=56780 RepID=Q2LTR8_SYNAS|nr:flavodoxin-dependent (E)-4-hydroxy-3-methylbut-2-enyl-diphosphate synthase [Syntrophus aciditrophicus]ABC77480.1 1-hydroxy-2-methyl-2-(E)-butenyl 4-diphosphate synthase [Syntrophus aciditrophicus SB]
MNNQVKRRKTKAVNVGKVQVGGGAPVAVQSMTCTDTRNVRETIEQIEALEKAGCEIVRVAVPDAEAASVLGKIKKSISIPLIADIHFNHHYALMAIEQDVDGIRINPGNVGKKNIAEIVRAAKDHNTVIRIGVNAGSLEKELQEKHGGPTAHALTESALNNLAFVEDMGFDRIKLSLKSSHVPTMIDAYRLVADKTDYPLHLGVTEAGTLVTSAVKSSIGMGLLLHEGIGDTIRVSVTGSPVLEIGIAYDILRALDIRRVGPDIISCPTCGRCEIDLFGLVEQVEHSLSGMKDYMKIALMGCVVNGPGEAAEADVGIAGGRGMGLLFKKGQVIRKIREEEFVKALLQEIQEMTGE